MARLTAAEREMLKKLSEKAQAEEAEDNDLEIHVKTESGHVVTLQGQRARNFLKKHGLDEDDLEEAEEALEEEGEELGEEVEEVAKAPAAKKAAAPPAKKAAPKVLPPDEKPGGDSGGYFRRRG